MTCYAGYTPYHAGFLFLYLAFLGWLVSQSTATHFRVLLVATGSVVLASQHLLFGAVCASTSVSAALYAHFDALPLFQARMVFTWIWTAMLALMASHCISQGSSRFKIAKLAVVVVPLLVACIEWWRIEFDAADQLPTIIWGLFPSECTIFVTSVTTSLCMSLHFIDGAWSIAAFSSFFGACSLKLSAAVLHSFYDLEYAHLHARTHICTHACTHTRTHTCTHAHMHARTVLMEESCRTTVKMLPPRTGLHCSVRCWTTQTFWLFIFQWVMLPSRTRPRSLCGHTCPPS